MNKEFLPNLFVLGAAKCGTSTLHNYLKEMVDICMSDPKEPFFFEGEFQRGLGFYQKKYFNHWEGEKIIGESRHRNLILPYVPERIFQVNPQAKLIVIIRNPVDRAISHWKHLRIRNSEELSFKEAIEIDLNRISSGKNCSTKEEIKNHILKLQPEKRGQVMGKGLYRTYVDSGYYALQIKRYLSIFPLENLKIIRFNDLIHQPESTIKHIISFLGLSPERNHFTGEIWSNRTGRKESVFRKLKQRVKQTTKRKVSKSEIDEKTVDFLYEHFTDFNKELEDLTNMTFDDWTKK